MFGMGPNFSANGGNGNVTGSLPVFSSRGVGFATNLSLVYNSARPDRGSISPGWQHNYELTVTEHIGALQSVLSLHLGDGRTIVFEDREDDLPFYVPDNPSDL